MIMQIGMSPVFFMLTKLIPSVLTMHGDLFIASPRLIDQAEIQIKKSQKACSKVATAESSGKSFGLIKMDYIKAYRL